MNGVLLILEHPEVAFRDCDHCKAFMYNHAEGTVMLGRDGQPMPRPPRSKPPCEHTAGRPDEVRARICAKIHPTAGMELSEQNRRAYRHWKECRAVGVFPDDPIVRSNAALLEDIHEQNRDRRLLNLIYAASIPKV